MKEAVLNSLAKAIDYPEEIPSGAVSFSFSVDDGIVEASVEKNRLLLTRSLSAASDTDLARLADYAAGRVLREEATLAYDPTTDCVILWQDLPVSSDAALLRRFFEVFVASCDWWQARVRGAETASAIPEMMIRP